jgi:hypothetical protein
MPVKSILRDFKVAAFGRLIKYLKLEAIAKLGFCRNSEARIQNEIQTQFWIYSES